MMGGVSKHTSSQASKLMALNESELMGWVCGAVGS